MTDLNDQERRTGPHLRVEAGPARWLELDSAQRAAYLKVAAMLAEALTDVGGQRRAGDRLRRTQTAFVMGGRGTGKTTVLSTLRQDVCRGRDALSRDGTSERSGEVHERDTLLGALAGRVVWLETLDMEPLPSDANLLAAILARIEDAQRTQGRQDELGSDRVRGLLEPSSDFHSALLELQRLQTDVALAWDGNLRDRRGQLDPDTYAVETMRVEQARLGLNSRFADTLDRLAKNVFQTTTIRDPIFVLPVDDFDLNPPTCLALLRVLRLISIPRLFTVILGDLAVAQTVVSLKLSHDIGKIADTRVYREMLAVDPSTVGVLAADVAANAIRKLLPPAHRVELKPMRAWESLAFRPLGSPSEPALHEFLAEFPVHSEWRLPRVTTEDATPNPRERPGPTLRDLLLAPPLISISGPPPPTTVPFRSDALKYGVYSGCQVLEAPPRRVADLWLALHREREGQNPEELITPFAELCRSALRETPLFSPDERRYLDRAIGRTPGGAWTLRALPITIRTETVVSASIESTARLPRAPRPFKRSDGRRSLIPRDGWRSAPRIVVHEALEWRIEVPRAGTGKGGLGTAPPGYPLSAGADMATWEQQLPARALDEGIVSALVVFHDLLALGKRDEHFSTPLLAPPRLTIDWACTEWPLARPVRCNWPSPLLETFFDFDCLKATWNQALGLVHETAPSKQVEWLAFAWISAATAVLTRTPAVRLPATGAVLPWGELGKILKRLLASSVEAQRDWLLRLAEMSMPEMGLPAVAERLTETLGEFWQARAPLIRERRRERLAEIADVSTDFANDLLVGTSLARGFASEPFNPVPVPEPR